MPLSRGFPIKGVRRLGGGSTREGSDRRIRNPLRLLLLLLLSRRSFLPSFLSSTEISRSLFVVLESPSILRSAGGAQHGVSCEWV